MSQAQQAIREMQREQQMEWEDPDKYYAGLLDSEDPESKGKSKGRGRARGRGRGQKGKGRGKTKCKGISKSKGKGEEDGNKADPQGEPSASSAAIERKAVATDG